MVGHIYRMTKAISCLLLAVALMGCGHEKAAISSSAAPVHVARPDTPVLVCWFVESDGHGHHGYTALDARISSWNPEAWPLFKSTADLRAAIIRDGLTNGSVTTLSPTDNFASGSWHWRALTAEELRALR
jgi:hypothetical protein